MRTFSVLSVSLLALVGCAAPSQYLPPSAPTPSARIRLSSVVAQQMEGRSNKILLDIYDFDQGCPDTCARLRSQGYQGTVTMLDPDAGLAVRLPPSAGPRSPDGAQARFAATEANEAISVPAGKRIVLKAAFLSPGIAGGVSCGAVMSFVPEPGHAYVYAFVAPHPRRPACSAVLREKSQVDGQTSLLDVPSLTVTALRSSEAGCGSPEICQWKTRPADPSAAARPMGPGITRPELIHSVPLTLSMEAIQAGVTGLMLVKCVVTTEGMLRDCRIVKGLPYMNEALLEVLPHWRYKPALLNGKPVNVEFVLPVTVIRRDAPIQGLAPDPRRLDGRDLFDLR